VSFILIKKANLRIRRTRKSDPTQEQHMLFYTRAKPDQLKGTKALEMAELNLLTLLLLLLD